MNPTQIMFLTKNYLQQAELAENMAELLAVSILYAAPTDSAGGKGSNAANQKDTDTRQASDGKREKKDNTGKARGQDITNQSNDQKDNASITDPDTNLTGDTGNMDIGQTDLGASGTGAEDL